MHSIVYMCEHCGKVDDWDVCGAWDEENNTYCRYINETEEGWCKYYVTIRWDCYECEIENDNQDYSI